MTRIQMCHGLLDSGTCYVGLATFQKLCFLEHLERFDFVDPERIAISSHSLGTETAIATGLLCNRIKAIVFNDFLHDDRRRYVSVTEEPEREMIQDIGNWHIIPGKMRYFAFQDLCAAFAPRYLALTEGGRRSFSRSSSGPTGCAALQIICRSPSIRPTRIRRPGPCMNRCRSSGFPKRTITRNTAMSWCRITPSGRNRR